MRGHRAPPMSVRASHAQHAVEAGSWCSVPSPEPALWVAGPVIPSVTTTTWMCCSMTIGFLHPAVGGSSGSAALVSPSASQRGSLTAAPMAARIAANAGSTSLDRAERDPRCSSGTTVTCCKIHSGSGIDTATADLDAARRTGLGGGVYEMCTGSGGPVPRSTFGADAWTGV
jgi:hypothetical protein